MEYKSSIPNNNLVHEPAYWEEYSRLKEIEELTRLKEDIGKSYTEKFKMFTTLMRITHMLGNAKITHKKM